MSIALALSACVVVPRTEIVFDDECKLMRKTMVLDVQQVASLGRCSNDGCLTLLVAAGVITATSAVVSGSIAVVGNVAYWLERQGQCFKP
jgi:hypothetical protein